MTMPVETHRIDFRVYYEDTDAGGIVYHANYLKFAERGRTEWLRATGWDHGRVKAECDLILVVRKIEIDYLAPARLDDLITVTSRVTHLGNASLTMSQSLTRGTMVLAELKVVVVAVGSDGKPLRIPPQLRQIFGVAVAS